MRYLDVCSGISAPTMAWKPLGWEAACFAEIEAAPRAVLAHHYPDVPLRGDFTEIEGTEYGPIDLLVGGTPCQSFSIAGLRGGLGDDRGNLALEFARLADRARPRWLVWENVPGVLSIDEGRAFGSILGAMAELGYGTAYRVLDAQHFGVPQRRRRVFVVGYLGDWRRAAAVLFERHSLSGNPAPRRETGKVAPTIPSRSLGGGGLGTDFDCDGGLIASTGDVAHCLNAGGMGRQDYETETLIAHSLRGEGFDASEDGTGRGTPLVAVDPFVIMERGRTDGPNLEYRNDGTANAILTPNGGRGGLGVGAVAYQTFGDGAVYETGDITAPLRTGTDNAASIVAFAQNQRDEIRTMNIAGALAAEPGMKQQTYVSLGASPETMYGVSHADASQTHPDKALRALRDAVGAEAYSKWCAGILAAFRSPEILRSKVYGRSVRWARDDWHELDDDALSFPQDGAAWPMLALWQAGCVGRAPRGWQPSEQLARELVAHLSELPHQRASAARFLLGLWRASEGLGLLREALSALQEAWRPDDCEGQSARLNTAVRRLTPKECLRLQGFPDDYFDGVMLRGKPLADGPRYKMLGNSMAVPVLRWIGERIQMVENIAHRSTSMEAA